MASNNAPNTEDTFTFLSDGYTQVQYIPLTNISNVSTTAASSDQRTIQTILQELRSLQTKFEKFEETNIKIIKTLTEEVVALKTEVKQQRNMREKDDTSLIPSLPFTDVKDFIDFDTKLLLNDKMTSQLKNIIYRVGGKDFPSFLRMALKSIISDAMAVNLTWRGTNDKPSIQCFTTFALIKNACHSKYSNSTDMDINKVCQQHILHARDRVQKIQTNN